MVRNMENTPLYDNLIKERPISDAEVEEMLRQIENAPTVKCQAQHVKLIRAQGDLFTLPTGPCAHDAEYRATSLTHTREAWHYGKNVCADFKRQIEEEPDDNEWTFRPI